MAVKNEVKTVTDKSNPRPHRRRADQTMDVLAANIPLLLLADLAGDGTEPIAEAATDAAVDEAGQPPAEHNPPAVQSDAEFA